MDRRAFFLGAASLLAAPFHVRASHGWAPYDQAAPVYLKSPVSTLMWADPHPHLEILHRFEVPLPDALALPPLPAQKEPLDVRTLLSRAQLPPRQAGRSWRVELPSLAQLSLWDMPRPEMDQVIAVLGYPGPPVRGTPTVQAEVLFMNGQAYPLRAEPA